LFYFERLLVITGDAAPSCSAWSIAAKGGCALISGGVPQNLFDETTTSGVKGEWSIDATTGALVHDRAAAGDAPPAPAPGPPLRISHYLAAFSSRFQKQVDFGAIG